MGDYNKCKNCGEYGFLDRHKCRPVWTAICIDWDEDHQRVFEVDSESAAEKYAGIIFADLEYPEKMEIWIRKPGAIEWEKFDVTVEMVPVFSATKKEG